MRNPRYLPPTCSGELLQSRFSRILRGMEIHFTPEQEARLAQIASDAGTDAERLAKDAILRLLAGDAGFRAVPPGSVVAEMRALRARVKPDPEGWTTRRLRPLWSPLDAFGRRCFRCPCLGFARRSSAYADAVQPSLSRVRVPTLGAGRLTSPLRCSDTQGGQQSVKIFR